MTEERKYRKTHPWLTFELNLERAPYSLWLALGEAGSKCEHIAGVPLPPSVAKQLHEVYLAKGAWATTAIEGNTLGEENVRRRVAGQLELPHSQEYLGLEIDNVVRAINQILHEVVGTWGAALTASTIKSYNAMLLEGLPLAPEVEPGEFRSHSVAVGRYLGAPAEDCAYLMDRLCAWLNEPGFRDSADRAIVLGLVRAVIAHLYLAWIHPFGDGNGRTARLVEFQILISAGVPSPAAHLLSNHYNRTRPEYYRRLDEVSRVPGGNPLPFLEYAIPGFIEGLREQLKVVQALQHGLTWRDYVHSVLPDSGGSDEVRQRALVLALSEQANPVAPREIPTLTPLLAASYKVLSPRTLYRDLKDLAAKGLIERTGKGAYRARTEVILAFLPPRRTVQESASESGQTS